MTRCIIKLLTFSLLFLWPLAASAQSDTYSVSATLLYGPYFPTGQFVPMRLTASNRSAAALDGQVRLPFNKKEQAVEVRVPMFLPPHCEARLLAMGWFTAGVEQALKTDGKVPPLLMASLRDNQGAEKARVEMLARPLVQLDGNDADRAAGLVLMLNTSDGSDAMTDEDQRDANEISDAIQAVREARMLTSAVSAADAPRRAAGYACCALVILGDGGPDALDPMQQQALLDYVRMGGMLLLADPALAQKWSTCWLAPYLPVQLIGQRYARQFSTPSGGAAQVFKSPVEICEATAAPGGIVVAADADLVHAAYRPLGLGRVIFTSFPAGAMDAKQSSTRQLWRTALNLDQPAVGWSGTQLSQRRAEVLTALSGQKTIAWGWAAGVCAAYVLVVLLVQAVWRGPGRPRAFVWSVAAAILLTVGLLALTLFRQSNQQLAQVSLSLLDLGDGGGRLEQTSAFYGREMDDLTVMAADERTAMRPWVSYEPQPPVLQQLPTLAPSAQAHVERIALAWDAQAAIPAGKNATAHGQFTADGLQLTVENQLGVNLQSGLLVWNKSLLRLPAFAAGATTATLSATDANPPGDYTSGGLLTSQSTQQRGMIVQALLQNAQSVQRQSTEPAAHSIIAFADNPIAQPLIVAGQFQPTQVQQRIVRFTLHLRPSVAGSPVRVDGPFNRIVLKENLGLPYDYSKAQWQQTQMAGTWTIGFRPPAQIGKLLVRSATIEVDLEATDFNVSLHHVGGSVGQEPLAQWNNVLGRRSVTIICQPGDVDEQGTLWLELQVQPSGTGGAVLAPQWKFTSFNVQLQGVAR